MDILWQDVRFAIRTLRRSMSVTMLVTVSLALAIAGNTIVFSLINGFLYRPLPYEEPNRLYLMGENHRDQPAGFVTPASAANFLDWRERQGAFSAMAGFQAAPANLSEDGERVEQVNTAAVSTEFFDLLGTQALNGRVFTAEEGVEGNHRVVVIGHRFWQNRLGGDPNIVDEEVRLNGELFTVVGILPEDFEFLDPTVGLWVPLVLDRAELKRGQRALLVIGRLADGVTGEQAKEEMAAIGAQLEEEFPEANRGYELSLVNLREDLPDSRNRQLFGLLQGALVFVLLIACANIANLLLARSQRREREIAVRTSLGAGRLRILRQLFTESLVMAVSGGLLGLLFGTVGVKIMGAALGPFIPRSYAPVIDHRVIAFTALITVVAGVLFGVAPVLQSFKLRLVSALKDGSRGGGAGGRRKLLTQGLVVAEIALALVLLGGASVLIRSFLDMQNRDPGFDTSPLLTLTLSLPESKYIGDDGLLQGTEQLLERLAALPGVEAVAASNNLPRSPFTASDAFTVDARPLAEGESPPLAEWMTATPEMFATIGMSVVEGRGITEADRVGAPDVAVVNRSLAEHYWPSGGALGQRVTIQGKSREIVGVVGDALHGFILTGEGPHNMVYLPLVQNPHSNLAITLRTQGAPRTLIEPVRQAVTDFDGNLAVAQVLPLDDFVAQFFVGAQIFTVVLSGFGTLALLLAALGTYGVLAYSVAQRTHEIGVRMAIGARRSQLMAMVTRQGLKLAFLGLLIGIPGVLLVTRAISGLLSDFVPVQPATVIGVGVVLAVVSALASLLPARRAATIDPIVALRSE